MTPRPADPRSGASPPATARADHTDGTGSAPAVGHTPYARRPVLLIAAATAVALLLTINRYGYFGDELYLLAAGRRLSWGYADGPPLVPALAAATTLLGESLVALRLPSIVLTVLAILVTAQIARELGGGRRAQTMAAAAYPMSTYLLSSGHLLYTSTVDVPLWTVAVWLLVRWVRRRDDRLLGALGAVVGLALLTKYLIVGFVALVVVCAVVAGPREMFRRPALWAGAALAAALALPSLVWQAGNGWPQLEVAGAISDDGGAAGRVLFLPVLAVSAGVLVGAVLAGYGLWTLLRVPELRPLRFLGWAVLGLLALLVLLGGRPYYAAGTFPLLWAVAAVRAESHRPARWWRWVLSRPVFVLSALFAVTALPVYPLSWQSDSTDVVTVGSVGWPRLADTVAEVYRTIPAEQRAGTVIVTQTYWQAGALERFGDERGLPPVYSGDRGFAFFGAPPESASTVLWVGEQPDPVLPYFTSVREAASAPSMSGRNGVWVCTGRTEPWSVIWAKLRTL